MAERRAQHPDIDNNLVILVRKNRLPVEGSRRQTPNSNLQRYDKPRESNPSRKEFAYELK
jgi:hypothetical protein